MSILSPGPAKIKSLQCKVTIFATSIRYLEYEDDMTSLNLPSLLYRQFHGDVIQVYNIVDHIYIEFILTLTFSYLPILEVISQSLTEMLVNMYLVIKLLKTGTVSSQM